MVYKYLCKWLNTDIVINLVILQLTLSKVAGHITVNQLHRNVLFSKRNLALDVSAGTHTNVLKQWQSAQSIIIEDDLYTSTP